MPNTILCPHSFTSFFSASGAPEQVNLYYYNAGTEDTLTVYKDAAQTIPWAQPIPSGGSGRVPPIFVGETDYRVRVHTTLGELLEDTDNLPGAEPDPTTVPDPISTDQSALFRTGDLVASWTNPANGKSGFVRANGGFIGDATITGSEIELANNTANAAGAPVTSAEALFKHLWQQDGANNRLVIRTQAGAVTTKGATADADWLAHKQIQVPDLRGRVIAGVDTMGAGTTNRLVGATMDTLTPAATGKILGDRGGAATHALAVDQLPAHSHTVNDPTHTHGYTTGSAGSDQVWGSATSGATADMTAGGSNDSSVSSLTITAAGTGITINNTGSGNAHNITQPFMALTWYIKL